METAITENPVSITNNAQELIMQIIEQQEAKDLYCRIYVTSGCNGLKLGIGLDTRVFDTDNVYEYHGFKLLIDEQSKPYLQGLILDREEDTESFVVKNLNPELFNTDESCSCSGEGGSCECDGGCEDGECNC